jgi:hypothetical protein
MSQQGGLRIPKTQRTGRQMDLNLLKDLCAQVEEDLKAAKENRAVFEAEEARARLWTDQASDNCLRLQHAIDGLNKAIANLTSKENQGNIK